MTKPMTALIAGLALTLVTGAVQGQIRGYTPPGGQTLPNQLEFFRPRSGVLDQYNQFVAPRENLSNQLRGIMGQQNADYQDFQNRVNQSDMVRETEAGATGTAAGFMNLSHYYGNRGGGGGGGGRSITGARRYTTSMPGVGSGSPRLPNGIGSGLGASGIGVFR